jgi:SAM-dependent methyltransferase
MPWQSRLTLWRKGAQVADEHGEDGGITHRGGRVLVRQLEHQAAKAEKIVSGLGVSEVLRRMEARSAEVRRSLERFRPLTDETRVLEVGSGAHGIVFCLGARRAVGCDPLAAEYAPLFSAWQRRVPTLAAAGERLPFPDAAFQVVLCDNVVDHAAAPASVVRELVRVLAPGGLLYSTVNVHHPLYHLVGRLHAAWNAAGLRLEIGPFADHSVHLTLPRARALFRGLPLRVLDEHCDAAKARAKARQKAARHAGDRLKRLFFKNAPWELVAERT